MIPLVISSLAALFITSANQPATQPPPLRIVVVAGEDAVNIVQQKTAVAPIVEIRDRNNLPIAGATVTFTLGGNSASFAGGLQTLTVVTNAAGQAAAAGISPVAAGAVQINVAAAFRGQTIAATIVQTNVMTAAEAAGAAASTATGATGGSTGATGGAAGAAGGGGGMSGTTIGIVGAAVAGGAVAATQVTGGNDNSAAATPAPRPFRATFTFAVTLLFQGCTRVEQWSGTLDMVLAPGDAIGGNANINGGTLRIQSSTCAGGPQAGDTGTFFMGTTPITGTAASLGFTSEQSNPFTDPNGSGGTNTQGFKFTGALNGNDISGTLNHSRKIESNSGGTPGTGSASVNVTLQKQ